MPVEVPTTPLRKTPSLRTVRHVAALSVDRLDSHATLLRDTILPALQQAEGRITSLEAVRSRPFLGRLKWLVLGA